MVVLNVYDSSNITYHTFWRNFLNEVHTRYDDSNYRWIEKVNAKLAEYQAYLINDFSYLQIHFSDNQMAEIFLLTNS